MIEVAEAFGCRGRQRRHVARAVGRIASRIVDLHQQPLCRQLGRAFDALDVQPRVVAQRLAEQTGQQFVVDNRAGANGTVGSDHVAKAAADGYTLLVQASIFVANPLFLPNVPYDVQKDFTPVVNLGSVLSFADAMLFADDERSSYEAVASRLDLPIGSIGPTRARCLDKLRKLLAKL